MRVDLHYVRFQFFMHIFPYLSFSGLFFTSYLHRCMQCVRFQKKIVLFLTVLKFQFKQKVAEKNETKPSCSPFAKQTYVHYLFIHWIFIIISNIYLLKIMQKKWEDHNRHRKKTEMERKIWRENLADKPSFRFDKRFISFHIISYFFCGQKNGTVHCNTFGA